MDCKSSSSWFFTYVDDGDGGVIGGGVIGWVMIECALVQGVKMG